MTGCGHEGGFWDGGHILFLDLGAHYSVCENSPAVHFIFVRFSACVLYFTKPLYSGFLYPHRIGNCNPERVNDTVHLTSE